MKSSIMIETVRSVFYEYSPCQYRKSLYVPA